MGTGQTRHHAADLNAARKRDQGVPSRRAELRRSTLVFLYWLFRHAPRPLSILQVRSLTGLASLAWVFPANPVRRACENVAVLAGAAGHDIQPRATYRRLVTELRRAARAFLDLTRDGPEAIRHHADLPLEAAETIRRSLQSQSGCVLVVPHNVGSILFSVRLSRDFPLLVLLKNTTSEARDGKMLDFFSSLDVDAFMTRSVHPLGLVRACLRAKKQGKVIVATVDNIYTARQNRVYARMFGEQVPLIPWASKIALQSSIPIVPGWVTMRGDRFEFLAGQPYTAGSVQDSVQHYADFFEARILEDPGSWLFLGHKRWHRVLDRAAAKLEA